MAVDPRLRLAQLKATKPDPAKITAFLKGEATLGEALNLSADTRLELMRTAYAKLQGGDAKGALELTEFLLSIGQDDVLTIVCWAQAHAGLKRYGEALAINDIAIALADKGAMGDLARTCRAWREELTQQVAAAKA